MPIIHPAPAEFTPEAVALDPILQFFHYAHLPAALQVTSQMFCETARFIIGHLPRNSERSVALRKLLEAKDAAVRANVGEMASETFLDRMRAEKKQLAERLAKLDQFLTKSTEMNDDQIGDHMTDLLFAQRRAMDDYLGILTARIENIEHKERLKADEEVHEVGGYNIARDGPPAFTG